MYTREFLSLREKCLEKTNPRLLALLENKKNVYKQQKMQNTGSNHVVTRELPVASFSSKLLGGEGAALNKIFGW